MVNYSIFGDADSFMKSLLNFAIYNAAVGAALVVLSYAATTLMNIAAYNQVRIPTLSCLYAPSSSLTVRESTAGLWAVATYKEAFAIITTLTTLTTRRLVIANKKDQVYQTMLLVSVKYDSVSRKQMFQQLKLKFTKKVETQFCH